MKDFNKYFIVGTNSDALHDTMNGTVTGELIRCKDCKHRDPEDKKCDCGHSIRWQLPRSDEWFCADAERKETS